MTTMPTIDEITSEFMRLGGTQEGKDYVRHLIEDEVWYTGGDMCADCNQHERYVGTDGMVTGLQVAHDASCPNYNGVLR